MSSTKISILGTPATGKTVLLAALARALYSTTQLPRISAPNAVTLRYTASIYDQLELGEWPKSTDVGIRKNLRWLWHSSDNSQHDLQTFDCSGQDFRDIFEAEDDFALTAAQRALKKDFFDSDFILLLFNFNEALKLHRLPSKNVARLELSYAPAAAVRNLRKAGVATYAIFTQADLYQKRIEEEWNGDFTNALKEVLPDLYFALRDTGSPYELISAVETELRNDETGEEKILPKIGCKIGNLDVLVKSVDEFLVKNRVAIEFRHAERKRAEERQRKVEEELKRKAPPPLPEGTGEFDGEDPMLSKAWSLISATKKTSTSFLQRKLNIGYGRADKIIEILEAKGYIGPDKGPGSPRDILRD